MSAPKKDGHKPNEGRDKRGRFADGNGGGPGRPKGVGRADLLKQALGDDLPKIFDTLRQQALAGDPAAIRLIVDKVCPSPKAVEESVNLDLQPDGNLTAVGRDILQAVAGGELAPGQGAQLIAALSGLARVQEITELVERIEKLEATRGKP